MQNGVRPLLPLSFQIGDNCQIQFWDYDKNKLFGQIHGVHYYSNRIKYDIELLGPEGKSTRIYNVDSEFVTVEPKPDSPQDTVNLVDVAKNVLGI